MKTRPNEPDKILIQKASEYFLEEMKNGTPIYAHFPSHVEKVQRCAEKILRLYPEADLEVVFLAVQLHDIGQKDGRMDEDHAVKSERAAIAFLEKNKYPENKIQKVAHCVRSHRNKDVKPNTTEARIVAAADSLSHMIDFVYIEMLNKENLSKQDVLDKLERDYRDINLLSKKDLIDIRDLYVAWKRLINAFPK